MFTSYALGEILSPVDPDDMGTVPRIARMLRARDAQVAIDGSVLVVQTRSKLHASDLRAALAQYALANQTRLYVNRAESDATVLVVQVVDA